MRKLITWLATAAAAAWAYAFASQMAVTKDLTAVGWHGNMGKTVVYGTVTLDGVNPTPIDLSGELLNIDWAQVSFERTDAPVLDPVLVTHAISGQTVNVYAWKHTSNSNPTLLASTDSSEEVSFMAVGDSI